MKTSNTALALLVAAAIGSAGCTQVKAKAAFKDGNKDYKEENFKKAVVDYGRAVALQPSYSEAWFYLGSSHQALFRPGKGGDENKQHLTDAIDAFKKSLETNQLKSKNQQTVRRDTLAALTGIYSEEPFKSYDEAKKYAEQLVSDNPNDPKNLYALANLYEKFSKFPEAEKIYRQVAEQNPQDAKACGALAAFYNKANWTENGEPWVEGSEAPRRSKFDEAIQVLARCASIDPNDPTGYQKVASYYWDKAYRDPLLTDEQKDKYADKGLEAVNKALALKPEYFEAVIYKGLLYRVKASVASDRRMKEQYLQQAAELQKQGLELKKQAAEQQANNAAAASAAPQQ